MDGDGKRATGADPSHDGDRAQRDGSSSEMDVTMLQEARLRIEQMLALLDCRMPPNGSLGNRAGSSGKGACGVQEGLAHGMSTLLAPIRSLAPLYDHASQSLEAAMGMPASVSAAPAMDLSTYTANANTTFQLADRLAALAREPVPGTPDTSSAAVAQQCTEQLPLTADDVRDLRLSVRRKRRRLGDYAPESPEQQPKEEVEGDTSKTGGPSAAARRSDALLPAPTSLSFSAPWIDEVAEQCASQEMRAGLAALVARFNTEIRKRCLGETTPNLPGAVAPLLGTPKPRNRVRAFIDTQTQGGAEIVVELRDVARATLGVVIGEGTVRIARVNVTAPTERAAAGEGISSSLLPSRFAYYRQLGNHVLVHAFQRQGESSDWVRTVAETLLHVAALRTLFDPLPLPLVQVPSDMARRAVAATLDPRSLPDQARCVSWKWCRVLDSPDANRPNAARAEWCAFSPILM